MLDVSSTVRAILFCGLMDALAEKAHSCILIPRRRVAGCAGNSAVIGFRRSLWRRRVHFFMAEPDEQRDDIPIFIDRIYREGTRDYHGMMKSSLRDESTTLVPTSAAAPFEVPDDRGCG